MPELLTKHPEVAIQVLEGGGARCGPGQVQQILTQCRPERFCTTSAGELCVFGLDEVSRMTQLTKADLAQICNASRESTGACATAQGFALLPGTSTLMLALALAVFRRKRRPPRRLHPERSG